MPRPHPPEFRQRTVEPARMCEKPVAEIATDLGISDSCLLNWMKRADIDDGQRDGSTSAERAELVELRRRLRVADLENEILAAPRPISLGGTSSQNWALLTFMWVVRRSARRGVLPG